MTRNDRHREPGTTYLRLVRIGYGERLAERVFAPAVADLQQEWRDAPDRAARRRVRLHGYLALAHLALTGPFIAGRALCVDGPPVPARGGGRVLLLLAGALYIGTVPMFGLFSMPAWAVGALFAIALRRWHVTHPSTAVEARVRTSVPVAEINFYSISAGGDVAGLVFAAGSIGILIVGVPQFALYLAAAAIAGMVLAFTLHARRAGGRFVSIAGR